MDTGYSSRSAAPAPAPAPTPRLGAQRAPLGAGNVTCSTAAAPCCARECQFQQLTTMAINGREREGGRKRDTVERDTVQTVAARDMKTEILCGL